MVASMKSESPKTLPGDAAASAVMVVLGDMLGGAIVRAEIDPSARQLESSRGLEDGDVALRPVGTLCRR